MSQFYAKLAALLLASLLAAELAQSGHVVSASANSTPLNVQQDAQPLELGQAQNRSLAPGERHTYLVNLEAGNL